jgi:hypothetical protein
MKIYGQIVEPLKRFEKLNRAFCSDKDVQQTLATFYSDILKFHKEAYQFIRRSCEFPVRYVVDHTTS